jgi:hypothetical protein
MIKAMNKNENMMKKELNISIILEYKSLDIQTIAFIMS